MNNHLLIHTGVRLDYKKILYILRSSFVRFWRDNCFVKAAALSYCAFLTFIPIATLVISLIGSLLRSNDKAVAYILTLIQSFTPTGFDFIQKILETTLKTARTSTVIGFLVLVWLMLIFFGIFENIINLIWRIQKRRSFLKSKIFGLFMMMMLIVILLANFFISNFAQLWLQPSNISLWLPFWKPNPVLGKYVLYTLNLILTGATFFLFNKFIPVTRVKTKAALWGSLVTVLLAELARVGYRYYLFHFPHNNIVFGSILTASILIVWLDYTMVTILFGCELTKTLHQTLR